MLERSLLFGLAHFGPLAAFGEDFHGRQEEDLDVVGIAALRFGAVPNILAIGFHARNAAGHHAQHDFGIFGRKLPSTLGRARLRQNRIALRRSQRVQRPARTEMLALEIDRVDLGVVDIDTRFRVRDQRALFPAIPQLLDQLDELIGNVIPLVRRQQFLHAEVQRGVLLARRHHVPPRASLRQGVDRRKQAREDIGRIEGRRSRRDQADMRCFLRHHRQQRHGVELGRQCRILEVQLHRATIAIANDQAVFEEDEVELRCLQHLGQFLMIGTIRPLRAKLLAIARPGSRAELREIAKVELRVGHSLILSLRFISLAFSNGGQAPLRQIIC